MDLSENNEKKDYINHRNRVRNRFVKGGFYSFEPHSVLEMMLFYCIPRKDTKPIAKELLKAFGSFDRVLEADISELMSVKGVGEQTAIYIRMILESYKYYERSKTGKKTLLNSSDAAKEYAKSLFGGEGREIFYVICLDSELKVINSVKLSDGTVKGVAFTVRKVVEVATANRSSSIMIAHNHPSGSTEPSNEDISSTKRIIFSTDSIDINLIDHLIVSPPGEVLSMAEEGIISRLKNEIRCLSNEI